MAKTQSNRRIPRIGRYRVWSSDPDHTIYTRVHLSSGFIAAAIRMAKSALYAEQDFISNVEKRTELGRELRAVHFSCVCSCIMLSVSHLEAYINELLYDVIDEHAIGDVGEHLSGDQLDQLRILADQVLVDKRLMVSIPERYQYFLRFVGVQQFDRGSNPYQSAEILTKVRNDLVHYTPESTISYVRDSTKYSDQKLKKLLRSANLGTNPFANTNSPFFPTKCLSFAMCQWATRSALSFSIEFRQRTGITSGLNRLRDRLVEITALGP